MLKAAVAGLPLLVAGSSLSDKDKPFATRAFDEGALRLDMRHHAVNGVERFTLERLRFEAQWAGPGNRRPEALDWGDYRLSVYDAGSGALLYRTGFDTALDADARSVMTEIAIRCPMPRAPVHATIEKRRGESAFHEQWAGAIDPRRGDIDRSHAAVIARAGSILQNGEPGTKVDLAILGDGYSEAQYDKFTADAARAARYLFSVEPFKRRLRDFNVQSVFSPSADSGITDPYLGLKKNTVFGCAYQSGAFERTVFARNHRAVREVASHVPYDFLLILANARRYGGSALFGGSAVVAIDSAAAPYLVIHEFAHVIGGLADEYYVPSVDGPVYRGNVEPWNPNVTISPVSGKWRPQAELSPQPTPWNKKEYDAFFSRYVRRYNALRAAGAEESLVEQFMQESARRSTALLARSGDPQRIGWFEGANGYAQGVYRAQVNCIMFSFQTESFCSVCSAAIERMIDAHCAP